jgi:hypothetical protein
MLISNGCIGIKPTQIKQHEIKLKLMNIVYRVNRNVFVNSGISLEWANSLKNNIKSLRSMPSRGGFKHPEIDEVEYLNMRTQQRLRSLRFVNDPIFLNGTSAPSRASLGKHDGPGPIYYEGYSNPIYNSKPEYQKRICSDLEKTLHILKVNYLKLNLWTSCNTLSHYALGRANVCGQCPCTQWSCRIKM